ncbi:family 1 glycosylhydrolase [Gordonia sinesedis]
MATPIRRVGRTGIRDPILLVVSLVLALGVGTAGHASAVPPRPAALPADFAWGVSSSGFQSEGSSPDSNWTRYIARTPTAGRVGTSVDFRHRYATDIELARALGARVYRIGIEWARVEPRPGVVDRRELAYYDDVLRRIVAAGMRPMITLDHWVYPGWMASRGGWVDPRMPDRWLRNARMVVDRFAWYRPLWITINEPTAYLVQEMRTGGLPPAAAPVMLDRLVAVHRAIYDYIHRRQSGARVSSNLAYLPTAEPFVDRGFLDRVRDRLDFVGVDYYYGATPADPSAVNALLERQWLATPAADGIYYALRDLHRRYPRLPLYVVETGMPTRDGAQRPDGYRRADHLRDLVYWVQRARGEGIPVIGLNYWSLTDNYEWGSYTPRFGLYTVDVESDRSLRRRPTDAVDAYRAITAANGVPGEYRPSRPAQTCSLVAAPASCTEPVR